MGLAGSKLSRAVLTTPGSPLSNCPCGKQESTVWISTNSFQEPKPFDAIGKGFSLLTLLTSLIQTSTWRWYGWKSQPVRKGLTVNKILYDGEPGDILKFRSQSLHRNKLLSRFSWIIRMEKHRFSRSYWQTGEIGRGRQSQPL